MASATARYAEEVKRVCTVIDRWLADGNGKGPREYIMGDKLSFVDLAFLPWQVEAVPMLESIGVDSKTELPRADAWLRKLAARPSIAPLLEQQKELRAAAKRDAQKN